MFYQKFKSIIDALIKDLEAIRARGANVTYSWLSKTDEDMSAYSFVNVTDYNFEHGIFLKTQGDPIDISAGRIKDMTRSKEPDEIMTYIIDCDDISYYISMIL